MDEMLDLIDPAYQQVDHRALTDSGVSRDDWTRLMWSWWDLVPDIRAVEFEILA